MKGVPAEAPGTRPRSSLSQRPASQEDRILDFSPVYHTGRPDWFFYFKEKNPLGNYRQTM